MNRQQRSVSSGIGFCALLAVVAIAVFGKGVSPYLHSDDWVLLTWARPQGFHTVTGWFSADIARVWAFRPTVLSMFSLTSALGEGYPQHLVSLLFHLATAILLFVALRMEAVAVAVGRRRLDHLWPAGLASLFFLVHPSHDEAVYWFSAIAYPLAAFFGVSGWILCSSPRLGRQVCGWAAFGVALLAHPTAAVFPLASAVATPAGAKARRCSLVAAAAAAIFLAFSVALGPSSNTLHLSIGELLKNVVRLIAIGAWPLGPSMAAAAVAVGLGLIAVIVISRRNRVATAATLIIVGSAMTFAAAFPGVESPRYLYLPVLGISLLLGSLLNRIAYARPALVAYSVFVLVGGMGSNIHRASVWNDAGALGDRVFAALLPRLPAGPARVVLAGEPDSLSGAYVHRHGLRERVQRLRPDIGVVDLRLAVARLADPERGSLMLLFDGVDWLDVSSDRRGPCTTLLRPGSDSDGFIGQWRTTLTVEPGRKRIIIFARGTGALGEPATLEARFAGQSAGLFRLSKSVEVYETLVVASGDEDVFELRIANDYYDPGRGLDRNVWVKLAVITCA